MASTDAGPARADPAETDPAVDARRDDDDTISVRPTRSEPTECVTQGLSIPARACAFAMLGRHVRPARRLLLPW
ncbi:hypothetical protein QL996_12320 [Planococcus sp. APC 4015]|nr:hypothetical protein [Planococcus sp. APC 4015]